MAGLGGAVAEGALDGAADAPDVIGAAVGAGVALPAGASASASGAATKTMAKDPQRRRDRMLSVEHGGAFGENRRQNVAVKPPRNEPAEGLS